MKINFGCGKDKMAGFIGVDRLSTEGVDVISDMNLFPYPFRDNSIEEVFFCHLLEHLPDTVRVMEEIHRICKDRATVRIIVPYYNSPGAHQDPTHVRFFTEKTFDYFTEDGVKCLSEYNYYSSSRFKILSIIPSQWKAFSIFPKRLQWFLAHHLATVYSIQFILKVVKKQENM